MKKKLTTLLALLLSLCLLCGCTAKGVDLSGALQGKLDALVEEADEPSEHNPDGIMFSDMHYSRPDTAKLEADVQAVTAALESGSELKDIEELLDECMDEYYRFSTMYSLANIYNCKDLRDEYYAAEFEWISTESATVSQLFDRMYYACAGSPLGAELEEDYFWEGFCEEYADPDDSYYTDETVALMQRESDLIARYRELVADPVISFKGEERSIHELLEELSGYDYLDALLEYYRSYCEPLAEIYASLAAVRGEMAEKMGFSSTEEMEFVFGFDRDYTPAEAALFVQDVKTCLVPIYTWAQDTGMAYAVNYSPLSSDELYRDTRAVAMSIGGECADAFNFMSRYGLYDIDPSPYKADTSFQTYLDDYESPYIFLNPHGTTSDLLTFVHEFGHYTDNYTNFNANETIDLAECFSQSLEFLSLSHMGAVLSSDEIEELRFNKMYDALDTFIQQCAFADFESRVYALDPSELSADRLNALALQCAKDFGFCPEGFEEYIQYFWMDITHLFEYPFYVISYPVSLEVSMQIYALELEEPGSGLEKYFEILPRDYDSFMDTVTNGGLQSPFTAGAMVSIARIIGETLGYPGAYAQAA